MKRLILSLNLFLLVIPTISAEQRPELNADLIPKELKTNASAVIRNEEIRFEVKGLDEVIYTVKRSITILNKRGEEYAPIIQYYDKSSAIKSIKASVYDKNGALINKISQSKFIDQSYFDGYSLFQDNRIKYFNPAYRNYPFTVEYELEQRMKFTFYFYSYTPQDYEDVSVEKSSYTFICKDNYPIRIKEYNFHGDKKEIREGSNQKVYSWKTGHIKAYKKENYLPKATDYIPMVKIAPVNFEYEGIEGSFSNWKEYGQWMYDKILKGREILPAETITKIQSLVKDLPTTKEKVRKVYEYVQGKTRYVSIQKGIGGIQPMKAEEVDRLGYGDCKALSFYTLSLLKAIGINSYYTELYGGNQIRDISPDFANVEGNHAILCVPIEMDTVWLECTSQKNPFGYLGTFTDNRKVILCTEKGGVIAKTKSYSPEENQINTKAFLKLNLDGNLEGKVITTFKGNHYDDREYILQLGGKNRTDEILKLYPLNNLDIKKYDLKQNKLDTPVTSEEIEFIATSFAAKSGNRMFLHVNPLHQFENSLKDFSSRKTPIWISRGFYHEDVNEFLLPQNYQVEYLPKDTELENEFGHYSIKVILKDNKLTVYRKVLMKEGTFPAESYDSLKNYYQKIVSADQQKLVLVKI